MGDLALMRLKRRSCGSVDIMMRPLAGSESCASGTTGQSADKKGQEAMRRTSLSYLLLDVALDTHLPHHTSDDTRKDRTRGKN